MTGKINCSHQNIVDTLATHESNAGKVQYIGLVLKGCGCKQPRKPKERQKQKRGMSGYNCFIKECSKKKTFKDCVEERGWSKLNQESKDNWGYEAKEGCFKHV